MNDIQSVKTITSWKDPTILIVGDIILDEYLFGTVSRISPEAPVPVVCVTEHSMHLGGAGNVAKNIKALGGNPILVGVAGADANAVLLDTLLKEEGIEAYISPIKGIPTTVKTRVIAGTQHIVRVDKEQIVRLASERIVEILKQIEEVIENVDILVLSDYAKGIFSKEFMVGLHALLANVEKKPKILADPKVCNIDLFSGVFILTPNAKETEETSGFSVASEEGLHSAGKALFERLNCENLLATLGAEGMALFTERNSCIHIPTVAQSVYDVTGAGDTVIATLAFALANATPLEEAVRIANYAAGYAVSHLGVVSVERNHIIAMIEQKKD